MFWLILEVLAALAIAIGIVWWTFPRRSKEESPPGDTPPADKR